MYPQLTGKETDLVIYSSFTLRKKQVDGVNPSRLCSCYPGGCFLFPVKHFDYDLRRVEKRLTAIIDYGKVCNVKCSSTVPNR